MSPPSNSEHEAELRALEPHILPRQLRALERTAARLDDARPTPDPVFLARLEAGIAELPSEAARPRDVSVPSSWRLGSAACVLLGFGLLLVAALLVAGGAPGGH